MEPFELNRPESVIAQKLRLNVEKMNAKRKASLDAMRELQAARIVGRPVDTTADLFNDGQNLFNQL